MSYNNDFAKFALSRGISSSKMDYHEKRCGYMNPYVLEERQLNVSSIDIFSRLMMDRQIFLGTDITADVANIVVAQLLWLDQQMGSDITIICNSGGGSVYDGLAIIDTMNYVNADVATNVVGLAASMAAVISFMIHQPSHGSGGGYEQASDMEIKVKEINRLKSELYTILTENSQLTYEEIEKMSDRDHWLTAQEAIKYGFMDEIITNKKSPTNG